MCRFLAYIGPDLLLADLLYRVDNSLIAQSRHARERLEPLNGDGFGVGWYTPKISPRPCVFTAVTPAWSDRNLRSVAEHVKSPCFFAHVRAASERMRVSNVNCHPFTFGRYLWMHNGSLAGFERYKRRLRTSLPEPIYSALQGTTDSEHAFALFLSLLGNALDRSAPSETIRAALVNTIAKLEIWKRQCGIEQPSYCNFAVTDGMSAVAVRHVSDPWLEPASLYYSKGRRLAREEDICRLVDAPDGNPSVIIASERLTSDSKDWIRVAPNHVVTVKSDGSLKVELAAPVLFDAGHTFTQRSR